MTQIPVYRARVPRRTSVISPTAVKVKHASFRVPLPLLPQRLRALTQSRHLVSRLSAAHPLPQAVPPRAGAGGDASDTDAAAAPPARKARRTAPRETRKSAGPKQTSKGKKTTVKRKRTRTKKPRKIAALRMGHPDWPWPLHYWELSRPIWWQQMTYRDRRKYYRSAGYTGPDEQFREQTRVWKEANGY